MKCPKTEHISAYLDQELDQAESALFESHLQNCVRCAGELEEQQSIRSAFKSVERYQAPYGFATRVLARTAATQDRKRSASFVPLFMKFAEVAVLLIVIAVGIISGRIVTDGRSGQLAANINSSFSLDLFEATPPDSLGGAYFAMMEAGNEK